MNHPVIASANAETRFNNFLNEAEKHRQWKRLPGNGRNPLSFLTDLISALTELLPKDHLEAASDETAAVKS